MYTGPAMPNAAREAFLEIVRHPDERLDLAAAALLIAKEEYPGLDLPLYAARLDALAARARPRVESLAGNPFAVIDAINTCLFEEEGLRGNLEDYYDPRNSFLNDVLDRKRGIPITLSVIYMEVAARLGFAIQGVGFPGHFLVRHAAGGRSILIDPFAAGRILHPEDCGRRLRESLGEETHLQAGFLEPVGKKHILRRMLSNLRAIYLKRDDLPRAMAAVERLFALAPEDPANLRDRGLILLRQNQLGRASADLRGYLALAPGAPDAESVREQLRSAMRLTALLN